MKTPDLPEKLQKDYKTIQKKFLQVQNKWKEYADEVLPVDKEFARAILLFITEVLEFCISKYDQIDLPEYQEFLAYYCDEFYYGPHRDDSNYLDLDESVDGEPVREFFLEFREEDNPISKEQLQKTREKCKKILSLLQ